MSTFMYRYEARNGEDRLRLWEYGPEDGITDASFSYGVVINFQKGFLGGVDTLVFNGFSIVLAPKLKDYVKGLLETKYSKIGNLSLIIEPGCKIVDIHTYNLLIHILNLGIII